jgi:hypothetical protein
MLYASAVEEPKNALQAELDEACSLCASWNSLQLEASKLSSAMQ